MIPTAWLWKQENDLSFPIMTQSNAAVDELLKISHCNSSVGCKSSLFSCKRYGLPCTACCSCQTENCDNPNNSKQVCTEDEEDNMDSLKSL
ncbi:hypothetical protein DPMN_158903 [Dreissena polymorpha]|uniref:Tesmin/TSO1-like CXC domain-containing protein n=1 Tax=Dreissena polymorpha TaxID=45954 RepID=A0A9D4EKP6_DREPO|nr:hypothetical protein DPMN_158903 [Dreissena polymorpha]